MNNVPGLIVAASICVIDDGMFSHIPEIDSALFLLIEEPFIDADVATPHIRIGDLA